MKATPKTPVPELPQAWVLAEEPNGVWRAMINLGGEFVPLGYFGSREDAEATLAAYDKPRRPPMPPRSEATVD
ncbi:MAG TPA: hypothetical protein VGM25_18080 [Caulobacteraceae bacterium]